jgi:hypothetical protein
MNKSDLKKLIKPMVKECINEVLLEEGMISGLIREVVKGLGATESREVVAEAKVKKPEVNHHAIKMKETRKKMMEAIGRDAYGGMDLFEGTEPLKSGGSPGKQSIPNSPLEGMSSTDPGVDITKLIPGVDKVWKKLI